MKSLLVTLLTLVGAMAYGADDIALLDPSYGGSGCPQGTVGVALSPDQKALSVVFDSFVAEAGKSAGKTLDRKSCNLIVPIHIPQGMSVSVLKVDYRGYVFAPKGTQAQFNVEYFLKSFNSQNAGPKSAKTFKGLYDDEYMLTNDLALSAIVWSACGEDVNLRINSSIMARTNGKKEDVLATVDSTDIAAGLVYHLQWQKCHK
jgi:hypothetical protein